MIYQEQTIYIYHKNASIRYMIFSSREYTASPLDYGCDRAYVQSRTRMNIKGNPEDTVCTGSNYLFVTSFNVYLLWFSGHPSFHVSQYYVDHRYLWIVREKQEAT